MQPNYPTNSWVLIHTWAWGLNLPFSQRQWLQWRQPQRGDIVIFHNPNDAGELWMKRVIGVPGDTLYFHHHQLYLNGQRCQHRHWEQLPRKQHQMISYRIWTSYLEQDWGPNTVPQGSLFVMGDNRGNSIDSRTWGALPQIYLAGRPIIQF